MFESPFNNKQTNTIFSNPYSSEDRINKLYQDLEMMKSQQQPQPQQRTVFTDINEEIANISDDERRFIETSDEYIQASQKYQNDFSLFLMEYLGPDFIRSKFGKSPEEVLLVIRKKKEEYKNKFAENLNEIRDQNANLAHQNNELAKTNQELQKELAEIRKQLGEFRVL
jgi:uncharacterized membrane protein